ncbi:hypothetical protein C1752_03407 [Acaryochloris thomasi RCC1774]|uniref:DUF2808 domain-containing protein n=1 Tax=Acaryochloris thomasi RCC1774 TaxID=1764569 RepID=A0A2W1JNX3_9CYAN|nr:DUF2808 domain-containing protein [Acaryochloris thomasi]PZD72572.1 hypothetical protein C1752_03407 [Acaryochloris thomasi RCC1774]
MKNPKYGKDRLLFPSLLVAALYIGGPLSISAQAVQLANGTVHFVQVPRLLGATVDFKSVRIPRPRYDFQLSLPDSAQESLRQVTFAQREGFDSISFNLKDTIAFIGKNRKQLLPLKNVEADRQGKVTVTFEQPIPPGTEFTIRLRAKRNPDTGGTYLFGVTAFPDGEKAHGQFLGFGRLQFYEGGDSGF